MLNDEYSEEILFPENRRENRLERKIISRTDRSKYKKTDRNKWIQHKKPLSSPKKSSEKIFRGRVLSVMGLEICVGSEGRKFQCVLRGRFKKDRTRMKNLIAVGDFVLFEETAKGEGVIVDIEDRKTSLSRADNASRLKNHLIAANIDQVIITVSVLKPILKPSLIDRYIIASYKGGMEPVVAVNKMDLLEEDSIKKEDREREEDLCRRLAQAYRVIGIPFILLSAKTGKGLRLLEEAMRGKASVFSGQSGVGKSCLINRLTGMNLKTGEIVEKTKKGAHTTTRANLLPLDSGGWCMDTPGIKSFGVWDLKRSEVERYFEEIAFFAEKCKFADCIHLQEPGCAVLRAVEEGEISSLRFDSYRFLIEEISKGHTPR